MNPRLPIQQHVTRGEGEKTYRATKCLPFTAAPRGEVSGLLDSQYDSEFRVFEGTAHWNHL